MCGQVLREVHERDWPRGAALWGVLQPDGGSCQRTDVRDAEGTGSTAMSAAWVQLLVFGCASQLSCQQCELVVGYGVLNSQGVGHRITCSCVQG